MSSIPGYPFLHILTYLQLGCVFQNELYVMISLVNFFFLSGTWNNGVFYNLQHFLFRFIFKDIFKRFYLFIHETEREREAETQAEGESGSMQGTWRGTRSQIPGSCPEPKADTQPLSYPGIPFLCFFCLFFCFCFCF